MKTDRLLLVAIVAVMVAVVGYLFFSDDSRASGRGDAAAQARDGGAETASSLGAFEQQKQLERARQGCDEVVLPTDFDGRSAEDVAALYDQSEAWKISLANDQADAFGPGRKVFVPRAWILAREASLLSSKRIGAEGTVAQGDDASTSGGKANGADPVGAAVDPKRDSGGGSSASSQPKSAPVSSEKVAGAKGSSEKSAPEKPVVAKASTPSSSAEKAAPWGFLLRKDVGRAPRDSGARPAPLRSAERSAIPASVSLAATPTAGRGYEAKQGDTLWKIAEAAYGKGSRWKELAAANEGSVGADGSRLRAGMKILIP